MNPDSITGWLKDFSARHNLPHINPHAFRHTVASVLPANGTDIVTVSKQLGHASVNTTEIFIATSLRKTKPEHRSVSLMFCCGKRHKNNRPENSRR